MAPGEAGRDLSRAEPLGRGVMTTLFAQPVNDPIPASALNATNSLRFTSGHRARSALAYVASTSSALASRRRGFV
jgi:hypothetical protein